MKPSRASQPYRGGGSTLPAGEQMKRGTAQGMSPLQQAHSHARERGAASKRGASRIPRSVRYERFRRP